MQMHDTLRSVQGASVVDALAAAFAVTPHQAELVMRTVMPELGWNLARITLSRGGLADVVEMLGRDREAHLGNENLFTDESIRADGAAVLRHILGSDDKARMLAARAARRSGVSAAVVERMLPGIATVALATLALRSKGSLGEILQRMPSLGRWSKGNAHADLADIMRRRCGGGPYASRKLRKVVHKSIADAGGLQARGPVTWYLRFLLLRPTAALLGPIVSSMRPRS